MIRSISYFSQYDFEVKYKPEKQSALADALSHRPDYEIAFVTTLSPPITDLIHAAYAKNDTVLFCYELLIVNV